MLNAPGPRVTVAVPSFGQAAFLGEALDSVLAQEVPLEVFVADGGSTDGSVEIIRAREPYLAGWRSHPDGGQAAAINECIGYGGAPYVCWLNSDDMLLPGALRVLCEALDAEPRAPAAYGLAWNQSVSGNRTPVRVEPFDPARLALRCIVSQPATLMRRSAWEAVGGLDESLQMAMDYDLWWRMYRQCGPLIHVPVQVAVNREHAGTKTRRFRARHYREAIEVVRRHNGSVPPKWWLYQPWAVWAKSLRAAWHRQ